jgi:hypothetical protein
MHGKPRYYEANRRNGCDSGLCRLNSTTKVFDGVSAPQVKPKLEEQLCFELAAKKIALNSSAWAACFARGCDFRQDWPGDVCSDSIVDDGVGFRRDSDAEANLALYESANYINPT